MSNTKRKQIKLNFKKKHSTKNPIDIVFKSKKNIKSRQWWMNQYSKVKDSLVNNIKDKKLKYLIKESRITLLITNNNDIQALNKRFRKINAPTDVLAFPFLREEQTKSQYLGDLVISQEKAVKQALKEKRTPANELLMLFIHGYLHLLGYDHKLREDAKIMFSLQNKVLKEISKNEKNYCIQ